MDELDSILQKATAKIEAGYFWLAVAGRDTPIYRERVYCYELYHQMRLCWPKEGCPFVLNGEVDKSGHRILGPRGVGGIPDFLVHKPGDMNGNYAIIEVKAPFARDRQIEIDLAKLTRFVKDAEYERAICLIYGVEAEQMVERVCEIAGATRDLAPIELWVHQQVGLPATRSKILQETSRRRPEGEQDLIHAGVQRRGRPPPARSAASGRRRTERSVRDLESD
jgi:hypothetical protein